MTQFHRKPSPKWPAYLITTAFLACLVGLGILKFGRAPDLPLTERESPSRSVNSLARPTNTKAPSRHLYWDEARCLANSGSDRPSEPTLHRWVDSKGVAHFSDRPPTDESVRDYRTEGLREAPPLELSIEARATILPPHINSRALADAYAIAKIMRGVLGVETPGLLRLSVMIVGTDEAFGRELGEPMGDRAGVYVGARRLILVRAQRDHEQTLSVLRHEIVHALVHEWIGRLPSALNEGLAEYFQEFSAQGMGGKVETRNYARRLQRAGLPPRSDVALRALLSAPQQEFYAHAKHRNYDWSLGLVSTMMSTHEGRIALAKTLQAQRRNPCRPIDAAALLSKEWRGGLLTLHQDWTKHVASSGTSVHSY